MGKFDGLLFMSDYDDTFYSQKLVVSPENRAAARYFMEQGGFFSFATGRAYRTFTPQILREGLSFNAPVVLSNGGSIYDYSQEAYLCRTLLSPGLVPMVEELCQLFPGLAVECYHQDDIYIYNPNPVTQAHMKLVGTPYTLCDSPAALPIPREKLILEEDWPCLERVQAHIHTHWGTQCEAIFSNRYLLEITDRGANKGTMVERVARHLGVEPGRLYCIGDNQNDLPMLERSAIPFAPANCDTRLREWGARVLCHCDQHAVARAIEVLDRLY